MKVMKCPLAGFRAACLLDECRTCPAIDEACKVLDSMGLVVYPTDTVYGLGGLALYPEAVEKVFKAKGRPGEAPITATVSSYDGLLELTDITSGQAKLLSRLDGQPITWVLHALDHVPERLLAGGITIGVRVMSKGCAAAIVDRVGPITATSANVHGQRSARKVPDSISQLGDAVDLYIDCGKTQIGIPSTMAEVIFDGDKPRVRDIRIIRKGAVDGNVIKESLLEKKAASKPKAKKAQDQGGRKGDG